MRLIIARHGETEENKLGIIQGHLPGKLSALGEDQARKLAFRLKDEKIDAIYSSDLARAADTAREIAKFHPKVKLEFVKELREKDQGELSGKKMNEINWDNPRNTEKKESMLLRAGLIFNKAYDKYKGKTVLFVSHGGLMNILYVVIMKKSLDDLKKMENPKNAVISIFEIKEDGSNRAVLVNSEDHLK